MNKKNIITTVAAMLAGALIAGPTANAAVEYLKALPSNQVIYLDGEQVELQRFVIRPNAINCLHFCV